MRTPFQLSSKKYNICVRKIFTGRLEGFPITVKVTRLTPYRKMVERDVIVLVHLPSDYRPTGDDQGTVPGLEFRKRTGPDSSGVTQSCLQWGPGPRPPRSGSLCRLTRRMWTEGRGGVGDGGFPRHRTAEQPQRRSDRPRSDPPRRRWESRGSDPPLFLSGEEVPDPDRRKVVRERFKSILTLLCQILQKVRSEKLKRHT